MSRIAKKPITIPDEVKINVDGGRVNVLGPKGSLDWVLPPLVKADISDQQVMISTEGDAGNMAGMARTIVDNMITGVTKGWSKTLELSGTGYRASTTEKQLTLSLGFSHQIVVDAPVDVSFEVKENKITVFGLDRGVVGEVAAKIRALRPADPYKAKGLKYEGEDIVRKAGKAAKATGTAAK